VPPPPRDSNAGKPQLVGDLLARVLNRKGLGAKLEAVSVLTEWESLVGPQIAAVTHPQRVSEGVLFVGVATSAWLMELNLMKAELMRRLNAGKGEGRIRQIVFVMGTE
jgi:predicted nucleic acid-binding Zn ribbon protein